MSFAKTRSPEHAGRGTARGIRAARGWADITAQQLADRLDIPIRTLQKWESGFQAPRNRGRLAEIADVCGVPVWLVEGADLPDNINRSGERQ